MEAFSENSSSRDPQANSQPVNAIKDGELECAEDDKIADSAQDVDTLAAESSSGEGRKCALFVALAFVWVLLDYATKQFFKEGIVGHVYLEPVFGLFDFKLIHNTGGAWGIFADSTFALGVFSVLVCIAVTVYFFVERRNITYPATVGLSLIVAGGIGNAIDRFTMGYVIDFIEFAFIDFPVFNVADIGVTCGFAIILVALVFDFLHDRDKEL